MDAQGSQANAKEDTVYLALASALATDLAFATDLTAVTGGGYELNSSRVALTSTREVYVRCVLTAAETDKILIAHHNADLSDMTFAVSLGGGGTFRFSQNGDTVWQGPAVPAADVSIAWSMRPNAGTTGAGDAMISEAIIYSHTASAYLAFEQFTHAAPTTDTSWTFAVGGVWVGGSLIGKPTTAPSQARVSSGHHPNVEFAEDWVAARSGHSTSLVTPSEPIGVGLSAVGDVAEWAGQGNVGFIGAHANGLRGRMLSPLVNEVYSRARTISNTASPTQWIANAPESTFKMDVTKLRWLLVRGIEYAFVRVHVTSWVTEGDPVPVAVRCYSLTRPHLGLGPTLGGKPKPPLNFTLAEATLTEDHTSGGMGEWLDLGLLKLSTMIEPIAGWQATTTFGLAYKFDPAGVSSNDANARLKINAWQVRPVLGVL